MNGSAGEIKTTKVGSETGVPQRLKSVRENFSFAPLGLAHFSL
jgi:hypothetical protein